MSEGSGQAGQMPGGNRIITLLCAASVVVATAWPGILYAADGAALSTPDSQLELSSPSSSANRQVAPRPNQTEQTIPQPEAPGVTQYLASSEEISLFGISLRIEQRKAEQEVQGLLVMDVAPGSPGAIAGLHPFRQPVRDVMNGVSMLATMVFPPAMIVGSLVGSIPLGEDYDLIIGVDGSRVSNFVDLYECMRDVEPGEIVYLNLLRNGHRIQVPLRVATSVPPPEAWVR